jgi:hypothetical protein
MDSSFSEQKSQYKPYTEETVSRARPPMIRKPNNLFLTGDIELFPEYRTSFVPYSLDSIYKYNKPPCYHPKRDKKARKDKEPSPPTMPERGKPLEAKILNNNYGVSCANRYHQKLDAENNVMPEYRRQYQAVAGQRSTLMPQTSNLGRFDDDDDFRGASEYSNRYKTYDHFTKSAPIKKQDNLHMHGYSEMGRAEYKDRYKEPDLNVFERRQPFRQQDNLHSEGDFGRQMPEYHEKYRDHHVSSFPERAKPRGDFLCMDGEMEYSAEYRNNYVEFPRQRPIVKKQPTSIRMPSGHERDRKVDNIDLPINLSYHESGARPSRRRSQEDEELPIENRPEYRRAMRHYMIKERSPSRASQHEELPASGEKSALKPVDHNDVGKILTENKINMEPEKILDDNNEVIVEPLKKPSNFKIPTRSPVRHPSGKGPSYPLQKDHRFHEPPEGQKRNSARRGNLRVVIDDYDRNQQREARFSFDSDQAEPEPEPERHHRPQPAYQSPPKRKSPKFGRRAPNPVEDYNLRTKTNVIEANPRYARERHSEIQPNRHEQRGFYHQTNPHPIPMARAPADSLANNYRPNYELDKQRNYRESLGDEKSPFVIIDHQQSRGGGVKPNSWMKKQWYDTQ